MTLAKSPSNHDCNVSSPILADFMSAIYIIRSFRPRMADDDGVMASSFMEHAFSFRFRLIAHMLIG